MYRIVFLLTSVDTWPKKRWSFEHSVQCTRSSRHRVDLRDVDEKEIKHLWAHGFKLSPTMIQALTEKDYLDKDGNLGIPCTVTVRGGMC
jgi:hypothetical protein